MQGADQTTALQKAVDGLAASEDNLVAANQRAAASTVIVSTSEERVTASRRTSADGLTRLIAQYDSATKAGLQYQAALDRIARYEEEGIGTDAQRATAVDLVTKRYNDQIAALQKSTTAANENSKIAVVHANALTGVGNAAKLSYTEMEILRSGVINVAQSLAAGESAARTFETQLFQIGPALPALARSLGGVNIAAIGVGAGLAIATAAVVAFGVRAIEQEDRVRSFNVTLEGMGATGLATGASLEKQGAQLKQFGLAASDAATAINQITRANLNPAFATQIAGAGAGIGAVTGQGTVAGIAQVTDALKGGVEQTIALGLQFHALTAAEADNLIEMGKHGQASQALTQAIGLLDDRLGKLYKNSLGPVAVAARDLTTAWNDLLDSMSKAFSPAAETFLKGLAEAADLLSSALKGDLHFDPNAMPGNRVATAVIPPATPMPTGSMAAPDTSLGQLQTLVAKIIQVESRGNSTAVSPAGAAGLMQLMPDTASGLGVTNVFNAQQNVVGGSQYIQHLIQKYGGDLNTALMAYNWGEGNIDAYLSGRKSLPSDVAAYPQAVYSAQPNQAAQQYSLYAQPLGGAGAATVTGNTTDQQTADIQKLAKARQDDVLATQQQGASQDILRAKQEAEQYNLDHTISGTQAAINVQSAMSAALQRSQADWLKTAISTDNVTLANNRLADAYAKGGAEVAKVTAYNQALTEAGDQYGAAIDKTNIVQERQNQLLTEAAAAERLKNAQDLQSQTDTQAALQLEISLQNQSTDEINRQLTILRAKQEIEEKFPLLSQQEKDARLASVTATADLVVKLQEAQREQARINNTLTSIGQTIDSSITNNLEAAFDGQKITSWGTLFHQVLAQIEAQLISLSIIKPAIGSALSLLGFSGAAQGFGSLFSGAGLLSGAGILGGANNGSQVLTDKNGDVIGNLSSAGSLASNGGGLLNELGLGNLFGPGGSITGAINDFGTNLGFYSGEPVEGLIGPPAPGLFGTTTLTGALGFAGLGGTVSSLAGLLTGNTGIASTLLGGAGGLAGGLAGSGLLGGLLGSAAGPVGAIAGGLLGNLVGGLFGGGKPANNETAGSIDLSSGASSIGASHGVAANDQAFQQLSATISAFSQQINQLYPGALSGTVVAQAGSRDGVKVGIGGQTYSFSDVQTAASQIEHILLSNLDLSKVEEDVKATADAMKSATSAARDQAQADATAATHSFDGIFASVEQSIGLTTGKVGPFAQAMTAINAQFQPLIDMFNQFGLSLAPINDALAAVTARLQGDFLTGIQQQLNNGSGFGFLNDIQSAAQTYQQNAEEAAAIGLGNDQATGTRLGLVFNDQISNILQGLNPTQILEAMAEYNGSLSYTDFPKIAQQFLSQSVTAQQNSVSGKSYLNDIQAALNQYAIAGPLAGTLGASQPIPDEIGQAFNATIQQILAPLSADQIQDVVNAFGQLGYTDLPALAKAALDAATATNGAATAQTNANQILAAGVQIRQYLNSLESSPSSFTSPESNLTAAQSQYQTQLGLAQGGDVTALQGISSVAQTLLQAASAYYASSAPGQAIFQQVETDLAALPGVPNATETQTNAIVTAIANAGSSQTTAADQAAQQIVSATADSGASIVNEAISGAQAIVGSSSDTTAAVNNNTTSGDTAFSALLSLGVTQNAALIAQNQASALAIVDSTNNSAATITAQNSASTGQLITTATAAASQALSAANDNTAAQIDEIISGTASITSQNSASAAGIISTAQTVADQAQGVANTNAAAQISTILAGTASITSQNSVATQGLISTAVATGNQAVATANENAAALSASTLAGAASIAGQTGASAQQIIANADAASAQALGVANANAGAFVFSMQTGTAAIITANDNAAAAAQAVAQAGANSTVGAIASYGGALIAVVNGGADAIVNEVGAVGSALINAVTALANAMTLSSAAYGGGVVQAVSQGAGAIVNEIGSAISADINAVSGSLGGLSGMIDAWGNATVSAVAAGDNAIVGEIGAGTAAIVNTASGSLAAVNGTIGAWGNATVSVVANGDNAIVSQIGDVAVQSIAAIKDSRDANWGIVSAWGEATVQAVGDSGNAIVNMLANATNSVTNAVFAANDTTIGAIYGSSSNLIGAIGVETALLGPSGDIAYQVWSFHADLGNALQSFHVDMNSILNVLVQQVEILLNDILQQVEVLINRTEYWGTQTTAVLQQIRSRS